MIFISNDHVNTFNCISLFHIHDFQGATKHSRRAGFQPQDVELLQRLFAEQLKSGKIRLKDVREICAQSDDGRDLIQRFSAKQIADRIKTLYLKLQREQDPYE